MRGCALTGLGRTGEAIEVLEKHSGDARMIATLGYTCGIAGDQEKALDALARLSERRASGTWVSNFDLALIQIGLDNRTEALALLQEALREKEPWMAFLAVDPRLNALRSHPKFQGLAQGFSSPKIESRKTRNSCGNRQRHKDRHFKPRRTRDRDRQ